MALKYGSKSGGFGLRSGNKSGMPFKQMGSSSPNKQTEHFGPKRGITISPPDEDATVEGVSQKAIKGPQVSTKGIDAITEVTTKGREEHGDLPWDKDYDPTKDAHKGTKTDMDEFRKNTVVVDGKTYDKGEEPQEEKKGFFQKLGEGLKSDAFRSAAYGAASAAAINPAQKKMYSDLAQKYGPKKYTEKQLQDKEYKSNMIKLQRQKIKAFEDAQNEKTKLKTTDPTATTEGGHASLDTTKYVTTTEKVQKQIAADKARIEKELGLNQG